MKKIAFVFTHAPHGSASGREGLDALLAASALSDDIHLFFLADGIFQLLPNQQPELVLARNYIATFGVLALYDIDSCYMCQQAIAERGLTEQTDWVLAAKALDPADIRRRLAECDVVLTF